MGSRVPEDSRPGPVSFSTALLLRVGVQRREQGVAAAARPSGLACLQMGRNLGACWMQVGQSRQGGEGWRTTHPFWSRRLCSEALALRALAPPKARGLKAWQCLLSHALTLGPSPQARLPRCGAGGGNLRAGACCAAENSLVSQSSRFVPPACPPHIPAGRGETKQQQKRFFLVSPGPPPAHPAWLQPALPLSALEASADCSWSREEQRGTARIAKKQCCPTSRLPHMKAGRSH